MLKAKNIRLGREIRDSGILLMFLFIGGTGWHSDVKFIWLILPRGGGRAAAWYDSKTVLVERS